MLIPKTKPTTVLETITKDGMIRYQLTATRPRVFGEGKSIPNAIFQVPIWFTTHRMSTDEFLKLQETSRQRIERTAVIQSTQLKPKATDRKLTMKEKLKEAFDFSSIPTFRFSPVISIPKVAAAGGLLPLLLELKPLPPTAGPVYAFPLPDITLESMKIKLEHIQGVRVKGSLLSEHRAFRFKGLERQFIKTPPMIFRVKDDGYGTQSYSVALNLPVALLPSYSTFMFYRKYVLKTKMRFKCAGEEFTLELPIPVEIVVQPRTNTETTTDTNVHEEYKAHKLEKEDELSSVRMATSMLESVNHGIE